MSTRGRRPVSSPAEAGIPAAANASHPVTRSKIVPVGVFAALFVVAAFAVVAALPINPEANVSPEQANSTLKCYDSDGRNHPCLAHASASESGSAHRTAGRLPSWTMTALYQVDEHPENWPASAHASAQANAPAGALASAQAGGQASAPAAQRLAAGRHFASARCGRHLLPCFFSAVQRGLTHIASLAAAVGRTQPAREHL